MSSHNSLITLKQAAEHVGLRGPSALRHAIARGSLKATKHGRDWLTTIADVEAYMEQRPEWIKRREEGKPKT